MTPLILATITRALWISKDETLILMFNFSNESETCALQEGSAVDLISGCNVDLNDVYLPGYGTVWLKKQAFQKSGEVLSK